MASVWAPNGGNFGDFGLLLGGLGVLFSMVFFGVHFWGPRESGRLETSDLLGAGAHQGDLN